MEKEIAKRAKISVEMAEAVAEPARYKTLYYGLKQNHPRNVAVVHPLMYMARRIIFAFMIVFMDKVEFWNVLLFIACTFTMLAYALAEHQWKSHVINYLHIFNECTLYFVSVLLLLYSNFLDAEKRFSMGLVLISAVFIFVVYNTIIILLYSFKIFILIVRRQYIKRMRRQ